MAQSTMHDDQITTFFDKLYQFIYTDEDSTELYCKKIIDLATPIKDIEMTISAYIASNRSASYFYNLDKIKSNLVTLDHLFETNRSFIKNLDDHLYYVNSVNYDKGIYHFELNDYDISRHYFNEIIRTTLNLRDEQLHLDHIHLLSGAYSYMAKMYSNDGKYELAKQYYLKGIRFIQLKKPEDLASLYRNYSLLAEVYEREGKYAISNDYFVKSLMYNLTNNGHSNRIISECSHIIDNHLKLSQLDSANYYVNILKDHLSDNHPLTDRFHLAKAEIYQSQKNYDSAFAQFQSALKFSKQKWNQQHHNEIALIYNDIAQLQFLYKKPQAALKHYNLAIEQLSKKSSVNEATLIKVLRNKAQASNLLQTKAAFLESLKTVNLGIRTLDSLKPTFQNTVDKSVFFEDAFPLFESGIEAAFELFTVDKDNAYIDMAFNFSEKSKNVLLFEALLSAKATKYGLIPELLLDKEKQIKAKLIHLENQISKSKQSTAASEDELFNIRKDYRDLIHSIEKNHKDYYDLKYNTEVISLKQFQSTLNSDQLFISYFYGNEHIYIISVSKDSKQFHRVELNVFLETEIVKVYDLLNNPKSDVTVLSKSSYRLYELLLQPSLKTHSAKKVIINADGILNYIPFGSLNTSKDGLNYLIKNHAISYVNSATLLEQLQEKKSTNQQLMAFAPSFQAGKSLLPLPNNEKEVSGILNYFEGKSYTHKNASSKQFFDALSDYGLIHLATHAVIDDSSPENSFLAFTSVSKDEDIVHARELYNLNLQNVSLVTLSACESGIGNLKRGEGFMSLARGFYFSGASSIASTLWKINDASSTTIMDDFYRHLSEGAHKDVALQQAQLDFLENNSQNALSHPYYWSAFVISGNSEAIVTPNYWIWAIIGGLCLIAILVFFRRKKSV
ncbi:MAG: CHAT domain-containing protein [Aquaticitalea sp.]